MNNLLNPRAFSRGFSFLIVAVLLAGCGRPQGDPYVIGHLAPRTGPDQTAGIRVGDAIAIVVSETNVSEEKQIDRRPRHTGDSLLNCLAKHSARRRQTQSDT